MISLFFNKKKPENGLSGLSAPSGLIYFFSETEKTTASTAESLVRTASTL